MQNVCYGGGEGALWRDAFQLLARERPYSNGKARLVGVDRFDKELVTQREEREAVLFEELIGGEVASGGAHKDERTVVDHQVVLKERLW